jgi:hypothetical protein
MQARRSHCCGTLSYFIRCASIQQDGASVDGTNTDDAVQSAGRPLGQRRTGFRRIEPQLAPAFVPNFAPAPPTYRADAFDTLLFVIFLFGFTTGVGFKLGAGFPVPSALAGGAAVALMLRRLDLVTERHLGAFLLVVLVLLGSVLSASEYSMLGERTKGLIQLVYSLLIAYGIYLVLIGYRREQLAHIFMVASLVIIFGCALERFVPEFRALSDAFRTAVYDFGVYQSDLRDVVLYGGVRPKLFTSEPSVIAFAYLTFAFSWYALTRFPAKLFVFCLLLGAGYVVMRSPTILLGLPLAGAYELMLAPRYANRRGRMSVVRLAFGIVACGALGVMFVLVGVSLFSERVEQLLSGNDASFFIREIGPALVALDVIKDFPLAGAGLTGEEYVERRVWQVYFTSPFAEFRYRANPVNSIITNYFWLHWIYLGLGFGVAVLLVLNRWLKKLDVPNRMFCWAVWVIFGQAIGGYVTPRTWCVLAVASAITTLHVTQPGARRTAVRRPPVIHTVTPPAGAPARRQPAAARTTAKQRQRDESMAPSG